MFQQAANSKTRTRLYNNIKTCSKKVFPIALKLAPILPLIYFFSNFSFRNISQLLNDLFWQSLLYFFLTYIVLFIYFVVSCRSGVFQRQRWGGESFIEYYKNGLLIHKKAFDKYGKLVSEQDYPWDQWENEFEEKQNSLLKTVEPKESENNFPSPKDDFWENAKPKVEN